MKFDREYFNDNGFQKIDGYIPRDVISRIKSEAVAVFERQMRRHKLLNGRSSGDERTFEGTLYRLFAEHKSSFIGAGKLCQHLVSLHQLATSEVMLDLVKAAGVTSPTICTRPVLYFNSPHLAEREIFYKMPAHQDWRSMQGSLDAVVVWVPLVDVNVELGALQILPGSHLNGLLLSSESDYGIFFIKDKQAVDDREFRSLEVKAGDAVIFNSFLVHRSGNNVTDSIRWSMHFRYNNADEQTFIDRDFPNPYIYQPRQDLIHEGFPAEGVVRKIFQG